MKYIANLKKVNSHLIALITYRRSVVEKRVICQKFQNFV